MGGGEGREEAMTFVRRKTGRANGRVGRTRPLGQTGETWVAGQYAFKTWVVAAVNLAHK